LTSYREQMDRQVPVLLTSASSDLDLHAARLGVSGMLAKPFDIDELCLLARQSIEREGTPIDQAEALNGC